MPRTEEAQGWFDAVYRAVQEVPEGKVTSYGHIARLLGRPERSRQVGVCLKHLPRAPGPEDPAAEEEEDEESSTSLMFHSENVPWQRIINSKGQISPRGPGSAERQAQALRAENVQVDRNAMGEFSIDFDEYGWFPDMLPSESGEGQEGADEDEGDDGEEEGGE